MEVICISDNIETAIGFRLSGINTFVAKNKEEANTYLENTLKNKNIGIIVVTEKIFEICREEINKIRNKYNLPLIVNVP